MKRKIVLLLCLALTSLACLESAVMTQPSKATAVATFVKVPADPSATISPSPLPSPEGRGKVCARVIAETAQHIRIDATFKSQILGHLKSGQIVKVIDQSNPNWWMIDTGFYRGYARAKYLQIVECEVSDER